MNQYRMIVKSLLIAILTFSSVNSASGEQNIDPLALIEQDFQAGKISLDDKLLNQVYSIKGDSKLSDKYKLTADETVVIDSKCATAVFTEIRSYWDQLDEKTRTTLNALIGRPSATLTYDSPGGHFKLHYDISGTDAVSATDLDFSGVPDYVEKCAAYCDTSWNVHETMGYRMPPSDGFTGGDALYDVYFESMGYYGYAVPEAPGPESWNDYTSYLVLHNTFSGFPPNDDPEGNWQGAAKATAAHEFHHSVQFGYDAGESAWYMELDATYMEDIIYDQVNDNYNYLSSFFNDPEKSLQEETIHMYSCFVWNMYLAEKFDTSLNIAVWEGARFTSVYNSLSDSLLGYYGWSQDSAFADFATWNYTTNFRDDNLHYEEGADYNSMTIDRTHSFYPIALQNSPKSPAGYGSCYVEFIPNAMPGKKRITFNGADSRQWAAFIIKSSSVNSHEVEKISLNSGTWDGTIDVPNFQSYYRVTLVGINLTESSSGANYSYSVENVSDFEVFTEELSDSALYSGGSREFEFRITNISSANDIFSIICWDDSGWVTIDTIEKALLAGADTVIAVPVQSPVFTPFGNTDKIWVKAISWGDGTVKDSVNASVEVVLLKGDANFSGDVNIGDITYLTQYLFGIPTGPAPVPVNEAGDYNCDGIVNIGDVSGLIAYLFGGAAWSFCHPY